LLFAGPKGTGKTTAARVLAAVLNDSKNTAVITKQKGILQDVGELTANQASILAGSSFLVREMDAASNRGIDDIRQLKEAAFTPPPIGIRSIFILDEAHMLTTEAWNALLKLLEEPPEHVIFILATTELQKIPDTIRSRCREVFFSQASTQEIATALATVVKKEKLKLEPAKIEQIAEAANGSFRDGIKLLEQIAELKSITEQTLATVLGKQTTAGYTELLELVLAKNPTKLLTFFEQLRINNTDEQAFLKGFLNFLHVQLISSYTKNSQALANETVLRYLLTQLQNISKNSSSPLPHLSLELALLNMIAKSGIKQKQTGKKMPPKVGSSTVSVAATMTPKPIKTAKAHTGSSKKACDHWEEILASCSKQNFGLATLLRSARAIALGENSLEIRVFYDFHREQLLQPKFYTTLCDIIEQISGGSILLSVATTALPSEAEIIEVGKTPLQQLAVDALM